MRGCNDLFARLIRGAISAIVCNGNCVCAVFCAVRYVDERQIPQIRLDVGSRRSKTQRGYKYIRYRRDNSAAFDIYARQYDNRADSLSYGGT